MNMQTSKLIIQFILFASVLLLPCSGQYVQCVGGQTGSPLARVQPIDGAAVFTDEEFVAEPRPWGTFCCNPAVDEFSLVLQGGDFDPVPLPPANFPPTQCNPDQPENVTLTVVKAPTGVSRDCRKLEPDDLDGVPCLIFLQGDLKHYVNRRKNCTYAPVPRVQCPGSSAGVAIKLNTETVAIIDQNAAPQWSTAFYQLEPISEFAGAGSLIHLPWLSNLSVSEPWDKWGSQNWNISSITVSNVDGVVSDLLTVDWNLSILADPNMPPSQEVTVPAIRLLKSVPYKSCQAFACRFNLSLTAYNFDGINSSVEIFLTVLDENNLPPRFDQHESLIELDEDDVNQAGKLPQVHAVDQDAGINCSIRYTLEKDSTNFLVDESTGQLSLRNPDEPIQWNGDDLSRNTYSLLIRATEIPTDDGRCSLDMSATTLVEIVVTSRRAIPIVVTTEPPLLSVKKYSYTVEAVGQVKASWNGTEQNVETEFTLNISKGQEDGAFDILPNGTLIKVWGKAVTESRLISIEIRDTSTRARLLLTKELTITTSGIGLRFVSTVYESHVFESSLNPAGERFHFNAIDNLSDSCDGCTCRFDHNDLPGSIAVNGTSITVSSWVDDANSREIYRSRIDVSCQEAMTVVFVNWHPRPRFRESVQIRLPASTPSGNVIAVLRPLHGYPYKLQYATNADDFLMVDDESTGVLLLGQQLTAQEVSYQTTVSVRNEDGQEFAPGIVVPVSVLVFADGDFGATSTSTLASTAETGTGSTPTGNTDDTSPTGSTEQTPEIPNSSSLSVTGSTDTSTEETDWSEITSTTGTSTDRTSPASPASGSTGDTVSPEIGGTSSAFTSSTGSTEQGTQSTTQGPMSPIPSLSPSISPTSGSTAASADPTDSSTSTISSPSTDRTESSSTKTASSSDLPENTEPTVRSTTTFTGTGQSDSMGTSTPATSTLTPTVNIMANLADDFTDDQKKYFSFNGSTSELQIKDVLPPNTPFDLSFSARTVRQTRSDPAAQSRAETSYVIALKTLSYTVLTPKEGLSLPEIFLIVVSCLLFLAGVALIVCAVLIHRYRRQKAIYDQSLRYPEAYAKNVPSTIYNSNVDFALRTSQSPNTGGSFKSNSNNGSVFVPRSQSRAQSINPSFARSQSVLDNDRVKLVDNLEADRDSNQTDVDQLPNTPFSQEIPRGNANIVMEDETHTNALSFIQSEDEVAKVEEIPEPVESPEPEADYPVTATSRSPPPPPPPPPPPRPDFTLLSFGKTTEDNSDHIDAGNSGTNTSGWKSSDSEAKKSVEPTISAGEIFMNELKGAVSNPYTVLKPLEFEKDTEKTVRFGLNVETISVDPSLDKPDDDTGEVNSPPVPVKITLSKPPLPPKPVVVISPAVPRYQSPAKLDAIPAREPAVVSPPAPVYKSSRLVEGNRRVKEDRGKNGGTIVKRQISESRTSNMPPPPVPPAAKSETVDRETEQLTADDTDTVYLNDDEDRTAL